VTTLPEPDESPSRIEARAGSKIEAPEPDEDIAEIIDYERHHKHLVQN
jgi:hypothetical protein